jgi:hypothetical protein
MAAQCYDFVAWTSRRVWDAIARPLGVTLAGGSGERTYNVCIDNCKLRARIVGEAPGSYTLVEAESCLAGCPDVNELAADHNTRLSVVMLDVDRTLHPDDNHSSGLHVNLVWIDRDARELHRFDPYYALGMDDSVAMQRMLDRVCTERLLPDGFTYRPPDIAQIPFGPQMLDASATALRNEMRCDSKREEFCFPWCVRAASALLLRFGDSRSLSTGSVVSDMLRDLKLPAPQSVTAARKASPLYFHAVRQMLSNEARTYAEARPSIPSTSKPRSRSRSRDSSRRRSRSRSRVRDHVRT